MSQIGYGLPAYRGVVMQRGYGLGGLFRGLMRVVKPHIKAGLKHVGKRALKTGLEVISDVTQGESLKSSAKRRAKQNAEELLLQPFNKKARTSYQKVIRKPTGRGKGRKRGRPTAPLGIL